MSWVVSTDSLPGRPVLYRVRRAAAYTVLHNSSSSHALPAFYGQSASQSGPPTPPSSLAQTEQAYLGLSGLAVVRLAGELTRLHYERCLGGKRAVKGFVARNHPLPLTEGETLEVQTVLSLLTALFLLIPLTYIPAAFVVFGVRERAVKAKHLQFCSGVNRQVRGFGRSQSI